MHLSPSELPRCLLIRHPLSRHRPLDRRWRKRGESLLRLRRTVQSRPLSRACGGVKDSRESLDSSPAPASSHHIIVPSSPQEDPVISRSLHVVSATQATVLVVSRLPVLDCHNSRNRRGRYSSRRQDPSYIPIGLGRRHPEDFLGHRVRDSRQKCGAGIESPPHATPCTHY
jgi:hypothetical protein